MHETVRVELLEEEPKIDSSIKSFASYLMSGMSRKHPHSIYSDSTAGDDDQLSDLQEVLSVSRSFSKFINGHIVPIRKADLDDRRKETIVVTWNFLVASNQKPTKHLGRTALQMVWQSLRVDFEQQAIVPSIGKDKLKFYLDLFQDVLLDGDSDDSRLIWAADGGKKELERRASDRKERAKVNRQHGKQTQDDPLASIEEVNEDETHETT